MIARHRPQGRQLSNTNTVNGDRVQRPLIVSGRRLSHERDSLASCRVARSRAVRAYVLRIRGGAGAGRPAFNPVGGRPAGRGLGPSGAGGEDGADAVLR